MTEKLELPVNADLPLRDVVFQTLRKTILSGKLAPGERLMEVRLAKMLGVSRTPVREAIRMLEQDGLVHMIPRRGAIVAEITREDLEDVLEVRSALEVLAVRKACANMDQETIDRLRAICLRFADCLEKGEQEAGAQADEEFHELIGFSSGNRRLLDILEQLRERMYRYRLENLKDKATYAGLISQHEEICGALEAGDEERAVRVIREHIRQQRRSIMDSLHID